MTEGLGFEPADDNYWPGVRRAFQEAQQEGLTQAAALIRLRELGVSGMAAVRAIEQAPHTADGITFVDRHLVSFAEGYGYAVTPQAACQQHLALRDSAGDVHDLAWVLRVVQVVDRWLDDAAPGVFRRDTEESRLLNRFRRIAAGPASEGQEAVDALNLLAGGNPRKGVTGTEDDLLMELGDTVSSALFAIQSVTKDTGITWNWVLAALAKALSRIPEAERMAVTVLDEELPPVMEPGDV